MTHPRFDGGIGNTPWTPRTDAQGNPASMDLQVLPADGVIAMAAVHDGRPCVIFQFGLGGHRHPPIALFHLDGLTELVQTVVQQARAHDGADTPPADTPTCSQCGVRIFGDVALFGTCLDCRHADDDGKG